MVLGQRGLHGDAEPGCVRPAAIAPIAACASGGPAECRSGHGRAAVSGMCVAAGGVVQRGRRLAARADAGLVELKVYLHTHSGRMVEHALSGIGAAFPNLQVFVLQMLPPDDVHQRSKVSLMNNIAAGV